jgi:hypothetical protein
MLPELLVLVVLVLILWPRTDARHARRLKPGHKGVRVKRRHGGKKEGAIAMGLGLGGGGVVIFTFLCSL